MSRAEKPYNNIPRMAPKPDRFRTKLTRRGIFRCKFGYGWGLCLGRNDEDKDDLITEIDRPSSATTIMHMSQRSKTSYASKQSKGSQASRATQTSNLSGRERSNNSRSDSENTLVGSALERKE